MSESPPVMAAPVTTLVTCRNARRFTRSDPFEGISLSSLGIVRCFEIHLSRRRWWGERCIALPHAASESCQALRAVVGNRHARDLVERPVLPSGVAHQL